MTEHQTNQLLPSEMTEVDLNVLGLTLDDLDPNQHPDRSVQIGIYHIPDLDVRAIFSKTEQPSENPFNKDGGEVNEQIAIPIGEGITIRCSRNTFINKQGIQIFPYGTTDNTLFKLEIESSDRPTESELIEAKLMGTSVIRQEIVPALGGKPGTYYLHGWQDVYDLYRTKGKNPDDARLLTLQKLTHAVQRDVSDRQNHPQATDHDFYLSAMQECARQSDRLSYTLSRKSEG